MTAVSHLTGGRVNRFTHIHQSREDLVKKVPARFATHYSFVPIQERNGTIVVAVSDPLNSQLLDDIRLVLKKRIEPVVTTPDEIASAVLNSAGTPGGSLVQRLPKLFADAHKPVIVNIDSGSLYADARANAVFLLRNFFITIPREIREAALLDGCSSWQLVTKIILPLSRPALVTSVIVNAVWVWNELLIALVFLQTEEQRTLIVGIAASLQKRFNLDIPSLMAGLAVATIPMIILYVVGQNALVRGLVAGFEK